jgi:hypothetical protein
MSDYHVNALNDALNDALRRGATRPCLGCAAR